jgi:hypothetical protein
MRFFLRFAWVAVGAPRSMPMGARPAKGRGRRVSRVAIPGTPPIAKPLRARTCAASARARSSRPASTVFAPLQRTSTASSPRRKTSRFHDRSDVAADRRRGINHGARRAGEDDRGNGARPRAITCRCHNIDAKYGISPPGRGCVDGDGRKRIRPRLTLDRSTCNREDNRTPFLVPRALNCGSAEGASRDRHWRSRASLCPRCREAG